MLLATVALTDAHLALADSCEIIPDKAVASRAVEILTENYAGEAQMTLKIGPAPRSAQFDTLEMTIVNPRVYDQGSYFYLAADEVGNGSYYLRWLDLGFTFYKDKQSGKFLNLAKAAGCDTFGPVYPSLDAIPKR